MFYCMRLEIKLILFSLTILEKTYVHVVAILHEITDLTVLHIRE